MNNNINSETVPLIQPTAPIDGDEPQISISNQIIQQQTQPYPQQYPQQTIQVVQVLDQKPLQAFITCRVCQLGLPYYPANNESLIRCPQCKEVTQVGPPPVGKQYIICPCNALLIIGSNQSAATCPRPDCRRTSILKPPASGKQRAFCAHCNTFLIYTWSAAVVICPKCGKRSVVNSQKMYGYSLLFFTLGLLIFGVGLSVTLLSYIAASSAPTTGFYFVMYGPMITGVLIFIRGVVYGCLNCSAPKAKMIGV